MAIDVPLGSKDLGSNLSIAVVFNRIAVAPDITGFKLTTADVAELIVLETIRSGLAELFL